MNARGTIALVRALPKSFAEKAIRSDASKRIDQRLAEAQHDAYCAALRRILGTENVIHITKRDEHADSCFVEDTVVILQRSRNAVALVPGAPSRRQESLDVISTLESSPLSIPVHRAQQATEYLDGGDVLFTGSGYLVGLSKRTSPIGAKRFKQIVHDMEPASFVEFIKVPFGLHLKSLCSLAAPNTIVASAECDSTFLNDLKKKSQGATVFTVPDAEAANILLISSTEKRGALIIRKEFPHSAELIRSSAQAAGVDDITELDMSELAKADGALTCCSVLINARW